MKAKLRSSILAGGLLAMTSTPVLAQQLEEIVVTAQRREQNLQEVPVSVTAVSAEDVVRFNINDVGRLEMMTPGLVWGNQGGARSWPSLRGVETGNGEANGEPSVAFLIDGVYKSRSGQANAPLVDIERVEVLRGPQGTLFGRNSTGGAINVISANPDPQNVDYFVDLTTGNYANFRADAMINVPMSDEWAFRIAARRHTRDGYQENTGGGPDPMDEDMYFVRGGLRYAGENLDAVLKLNYRDVDRVGGGAFTSKVLGQVYDPSIPGRSVFGEAFPVNPRIDDGVPDLDIDGVPTSIGVAIDPDPFKVALNWPISEEMESTDMSLDIAYDFANVTFRSVTGFADFSMLPFGDNDYTDRSDILNRVDSLTADTETFTQEFQLLSNGDGALEWVLGLFYMDDSVEETFSIQQFDENDQPDDDAFPSPEGGTTRFVFDRRTTTDITALAVYGQASYNFTDAFRMTAGLRWSQDDKDYTLREFGFLGVLGFNPDLDLSETFDDPTWRIGAEYFVNPTSMLYGSIATGFRSGGFNRFEDDPDTESNETIFDSEEIMAFELGWKSTLLDGRLRLNLAAYLQELTDQQVSTVLSVAGTGQSGFFNAGETEISGLELEADWRPVDEWRLYANMSLMNAEYQEFESPGFAGDTENVDLAGNEPPRAPDISGTLATSYDFEFAGGTLTPYAAVRYSSDFHHTQFNTRIDEQESYSIWDARLIYVTQDSRWRFEVYGQNLSDEGVASYGTFGGSNAYFVNYLPPLTYGVRATYRAE